MCYRVASPYFYVMQSRFVWRTKRHSTGPAPVWSLSQQRGQLLCQLSEYGRKNAKTKHSRWLNVLDSKWNMAKNVTDVFYRHLQGTPICHRGTKNIQNWFILLTFMMNVRNVFRITDSVKSLRPSGVLFRSWGFVSSHSFLCDNRAGWELDLGFSICDFPCFDL